jgi:hypothetical protein
MTRDPGTDSTLRPAVVTLAAMAALLVLSQVSASEEHPAGRFVMIGAVSILALVSAAAVLLGGTGRWLGIALATALLCASAGLLVMHLPPPAGEQPLPEADPASRTAEAAPPIPEESPPGPTPEQAEEMEGAARLAGANGDLVQAVALFEQSVAARERLGDPLKAAFARVNLALTLVKLERKDEARAALRPALVVLDELPGDHPARATARALAAELEGEAPAAAGP